MKQPTPKQESLFTNDHDLAAAQRADEIRACRLRCAPLPGVALLSTLLFCFLTPLWFDLWEVEPIPIVMIVLGVCLSLVAIPCHLLGSSRSVIGAKWIRSILFSVGILLNTVGTSLSMTAYYIHIQTRPSTGILLSVAAICGGVYGLLTLLCEIFPTHVHLVAGILGGTITAGLIVAVIFWITSPSRVFWSFLFFSLLWALITTVALLFACSDYDSPWLRFASFASFGILISVALLVLLIIACAGGDCDCDCGDDCGGGDCGGCDCGGGGDGVHTRGKKMK